MIINYFSILLWFTTCFIADRENDYFHPLGVDGDIAGWKESVYCISMSTACHKMSELWYAKWCMRQTSSVHVGTHTKCHAEKYDIAPVNKYFSGKAQEIHMNWKQFSMHKYELMCTRSKHKMKTKKLEKDSEIVYPFAADVCDSIFMLCNAWHPLIEEEHKCGRRRRWAFRKNLREISLKNFSISQTKEKISDRLSPKKFFLFVHLTF